jgi:hypothetical protein
LKNLQVQLGSCASYNGSATDTFYGSKSKLLIVAYRMNWPGTGDPYYTAERRCEKEIIMVNADHKFMDLALNILHQTIKAITAHITAQSAKQNTLK